MGVRVSKLYALSFLIAFSILIGFAVLSDGGFGDSIADTDVTNSENQMLTENRRGYDIEIRNSEPPEGSRVTVFSGELSVDGEAEAASSEEVLIIDGKVVPYIKTSEGYQIYYQPPAPDLPSAARSYIDTQPEK